jgi:hypothetical protein
MKYIPSKNINIKKNSIRIYFYTPPNFFSIHQNILTEKNYRGRKFFIARAGILGNVEKGGNFF